MVLRWEVNLLDDLLQRKDLESTVRIDNILGVLSTTHI